MSATILFVDDEPNVLAGYERQLRKRYDSRTATSGADGLAVLAEGPVAVVVSDMRMPGMNGAQFLAEARKRQPDAVRLLLTGYADIQSAIDAVNHGGVFRFLTKPCEPAALTAALDDALEQHRLVTAEKELLNLTLRGSVQVLGEVLAMVNPTAFGRGLRMQALIREIAAATEQQVGWEVEVAAILSQLGFVAVPERILAAADRGKELSAEDQAKLAAAPKLAADLIRRIPRLDTVIDIIAQSAQRFDGVGQAKRTAEPPLGARLLHVARDFDVLQARGIPKRQVIDMLRGHPGRYDPVLLEGLDRLIRRETDPVRRTLAVADLAPGMVLEQDLYSVDGKFLLRSGNAITSPLILKLEALVSGGDILPTLQVTVPASKA